MEFDGTKQKMEETCGRYCKELEATGMNEINVKGTLRLNFPF